MLRNILLGVGIFAALFSVLIFSGKLPIGNNSADTPQGEVVIWGTIPEDAMSGIIQAFNPQAKTYRVTYKEINQNNFEQKLLEGLAGGTGPDMIIAPHQIILSEASRLYQFPITLFSKKAFNDTYINGASIVMTPTGALALPVAVDPMVLFYNRTLLSRAGITNPPDNWDDLALMAQKLSILNNNTNQFVQSAVNLGSPTDPYSKDVIMAIVNQIGQVPVLQQFNSDGSSYFNVLANTPITESSDVLPLETAARFVSQFSDPTKTTYSWNQFTGNADDQFVAEKLAMYIGYYSELNSLENRNPRADFAMTFLPQIKGYKTLSTGAHMYFIGTLKSTKNLNASLAVESQFASAGVSPAIASAINAVPALRNYGNTPGLDEVVARSMGVAYVWYDNFYNKSTNLISIMLSDIINNRYNISDAANMFVGRLQDLYSPN